MIEVSSKKQRSWWRTPVRILLLLLVIIGLVLAGLWSARKPLAKQAMQSWCAGLDLSCRATFAKIGLSSTQLEALDISSHTDQPVTVRAIDVEYSWTSPIRVRIDRIVLDQPIVRGMVDDEGLSFYGLEAAYQADETATGPSEPSPHVLVKDGLLVLQTAAGEVAAGFEADGRLIQDGTVNIELEPASLQNEAGLLIWTQGSADLQFLRGAVTGQVDIDIDEVNLSGMLAESTHIHADIADADGQLQLMLKGQAEEVRHGERFGTNITVDMMASAARPAAGETFDWLGALTSMSVDARAAQMVDGTYGAELVQVIATLDAKDRILAGPIAAEAQSVRSEFADIGNVSVSGQLSFTGDDRKLSYDGGVIVREADASGMGLVSALRPGELPAAVRPHVRKLRSVLGAGLADFDFGASFEVGLEADKWMLNALEPSILQARNGFTLAIEPLGSQPWLRADDEEVSVSGLVKLGGGGGPDFQTYIDGLTLRDGAVEILARQGVLQDWTVDDALVSAQYEGLTFVQSDTSRFFVDGEVALAGAVSGVVLERSRLFGKLDGAYGGEGWRLQTGDEKCLGLTMGGARSGTLTLDPLAMELCPIDGRFIRQEGGNTVGQIDLGTIRLPFATGDSSGSMNFTDARLDWESGDELRMTVKGQSLSLPMLFGGRTMNLASAAPSVSAIVGDGPLTILAALDRTQFSGTMIPASVRADAFAFSGIAAEAGLEGNIRATAVHISDLDADPLYEPLVSDLGAVLRDGMIDMTGALLNEKTMTAVADVRMQLDLAELNGTAHLDMRPLTFAPGRLQPTALSEQLRGVLINTRGELSGQADFNILGGEVEGTGNVVLTDVSFDTLKTGTVRGVNGEIAFWDIIGLQSDPRQRFTIAEINPGLPLADGVVEFQLNGPEQATLESAHWPFAGGTINVQPTIWSLNGLRETVMVELVEIELDRLVDALKVPDLLATGTVSGTFPIDFEGANIMIREAVLKADAEGGTLSYTGNSTELVEGQNELADYGIEALRNFNFSVMQLGIDGNLIGRLLLSVDLLGFNENVLNGQAFDFGITVDSDLLPLLDSFRQAPTQSYVSEALALEREALAEQTEAEQSN